MSRFEFARDRFSQCHDVLGNFCTTPVNETHLKLRLRNNRRLITEPLIHNQVYDKHSAKECQSIGKHNVCSNCMYSHSSMYKFRAATYTHSSEVCAVLTILRAMVSFMCCCVKYHRRKPYMCVKRRECFVMYMYFLVSHNSAEPRRAI